MNYVLNYLFFYIPQVENGAAEMGEIVSVDCVMKDFLQKRIEQRTQLTVQRYKNVVAAMCQ